MLKCIEGQYKIRRKKEDGRPPGPPTLKNICIPCNNTVTKRRHTYK